MADGDRVQFQSRVGNRRSVTDSGVSFEVRNGAEGFVVDSKKIRIRKRSVTLLWIQFDGEGVYPQPFQEDDVKVVTDQLFTTQQRGAYAEGMCSTQVRG